MTGYPWTQGDLLLANDLNAAFAALGGTGFLPLTGGTLIGALALWADPSTAMQAATKNYVDVGFVPNGGGTMTGYLTLSGDPASGLHAATKHYVDQQTAVGTPPGGPFLPLVGGTVTGATTFNTPTTHGAGSTNYIQISGAASNPTLTVAGAGTNGALLLQSQGHGPVNVRSAAGGVIAQFADNSAGSIGNFLFVTASATGTPIAIAPSSTAGIAFSGGPLAFNRTFAYSGTAGFTNSALQSQWIMTGTSGDTGATQINYLRTDDSMVNTHGVAHSHLGIWSRINAPSAGARNALQVSINQTAVTANAANGISPNWTAAQFNATASFNEGGSVGLGNNRGAIWGQTVAAILNSGATFFGNVIGTEYDTGIFTGSSATAVIPVWIVAVGNARGTYQHCGIAFGGGATLGTGLPLEHAISFSDQIHGDTAFDSSSTLLYAEFSNANMAPGVMSIGWFADMLIPTFTGGFLRSRGFSVDGGGTVQIGTGLLKAISGGVSLDAAGSLGTVVVAAGGSGYVLNDAIKDAYGGLYQVSAVTGSTVTAVVARTPPTVSGATPANPVATTALGLCAGSGCTLTVTWTAGTSLSLNPTGQHIGFNGAAPIAKPTVTGAKGSNAALASLMTALATYGLVTDTTTA